MLEPLANRTKRSAMIRMSTGVFLVACLSACSTKVFVEPPPRRDLQIVRVYHKPFDVVWARAVEWFAEHNMVIDKIEKTSGLLTAKYPFEATNRGYLEYGSLSTSVPRSTVQYAGIMNMTVRQEGEGQTRVRVNLFGDYHLLIFDEWDEPVMNRKAPAQSTGVLEASILEFIDRK